MVFSPNKSKRMKRIVGTLLIALIALNSFSQGNLLVRKGDSQLAIHHTYLNQAFELTKKCVGFSAPVSGRAYAYFAVGMYETYAAQGMTRSLEGQLNGLALPEPPEQEVNWDIVVNHVDYRLMSYLYRNMPPSERTALNKVRSEIISETEKNVKRKIKKRSKQFAFELSNAVISWSKLDGGDRGYLENFPENYVTPECPSCWVKTFPGYLPALTPFWGTNRPMVVSSPEAYMDMEIFEYSEDTNSFMYKQAMMVYENGKSTDNTFEIIGEYWNDAAGYSGTPAGHFFQLAQDLATQQQLTLEESMKLYAALGIAINDAFIGSFGLKYKFNFIRPITYIHRHIDGQFNSRLASPPFPEFPSGHSFQSGAATEVMKAFFGDDISVTDSTNAWRTDIDGTPRTFKSFTELSEEVSISRFYGGIHFLETLNRSLEYGRKIGRHVVGEIKFEHD